MIKTQEIREKISIQSLNEFNKAIETQSIVDIKPVILKNLIIKMQELIDGKESIIIISKGHLLTMRKLIKLIDLTQYNTKVKIYYIMEGFDNKKLHYFEKGAVNFTERFASLMESYKHHIRTSVIMDPIISIDIFKLIRIVWQWVTDEIYMGITNLSNFTEPINLEEKKYIDEIEQIKNPRFLNHLYDEVQKLEAKYGIKKVKWNDLIRKQLKINTIVNMAEIQNL